MPKVRVISLRDETPYLDVYPDGIVELRGHGLMGTVEFRGPDLETAPNAALAVLSDKVAAYLSVFGKQEGWSIYANTLNLPAKPYLCPPSWMKSGNVFGPNMEDTVYGHIDRIRSDRMKVGLFEERNFISVAMRLPNSYKKYVDKMLKKGLKVDEWINYIERFKETIDVLADGLNRIFSPNGFARLIDGSETRALIRFCTIGEWNDNMDETCGVPDRYLALGRHVRIDGDPHTHVRTIGINGLPVFHTPAMLTALRSIGAPFRISQRFSVYPAESVQAWYRKGTVEAQDASKTMFNKLLSWMPATAQLSSADPVGMKKYIQAVEEAGDTSDIKSGGALTTCVVVTAKKESEVEAIADQVQKCLQNDIGFDAVIETLASQPAYIGSLPGEAHRYQRRDILPDIYLSRRLPIVAPWTGPEISMAPWKGPCLVQCVTDGLIPFRFDPFGQGWGHIAFLGPTGSGKSSDMRLLLHQWLARAPNSRAIDIDVDSNLSASIVSTLAAGGKFLSMKAGSVPMQPFRKCDDLELRPGMIGVVQNMIEAQGIPYSPDISPAITEALDLLAHEKPDRRTLSTLRSLIGPKEIRRALNDYCEGGTYGHIMDGSSCPFSDDVPVIGLELGPFAINPQRAAAPVVEAIMTTIESVVDGTRPTMILVDETKICKQAMGDRLVSWLARMRRRLGVVVMSLHFLDEKGKSDDFGKAIVLQCATKIFVPFEEAATETAMGYMSEFGITPELSRKLSLAQKGQAIVCNNGHARLVDFAFGKEELAVCAVNGSENNERAIELHRRDPDNFWKNYLSQQGLYANISPYRMAAE